MRCGCFLIKKFFFSFYFFRFPFSPFYFLQLYFLGGDAGCTAGVKLFNENANKATSDTFVAATRAGSAIDQDAPFLEKFALASNALTRSDDLAVRVTALEGDQSSSTDLKAILDRLDAHDQTIAAQGQTIAAQDQKIADLKAALQSKANQTYVSAALATKADTTHVEAALAKKANATYVAAEFDAVDKRFEEVDAQLVRIEGIRRERAADAGSKTPGTAGSDTDQEAGIDDQSAAAPNPAGPATEDGNNPPGAGDGQEGPCPDQQDPPECAAIRPAGCGTLIGQTNVTAVCPNLCSTNCNAAAATGTVGGDDGDEKPSTLTVGWIVAIALSLVTVVVCVGVAVVSTMRKKERGRQRALTQVQRGPAATNNPTFDAGDAGAYLEPSALQTEAYDDAAATRASESSSTTVVYAVPIEVTGGGTGAEYVPDGYDLDGGGAGANNSSAAATTIVYAVPAEEDADGDGIYVPDGYPGSGGGSISMA